MSQIEPVSATRAPHFASIDLLRGFAAISVVVYHVIEHFAWKRFPTTGPLLWFRVGWMGVDLFFVISGFVIAMSAFGLLDKYGNRSFRIPFMRRRIARIVPLHYLTCLVFLAFVSPEIMLHVAFPKYLLNHLFFFHNLDAMSSGAINGVNWSIGVEMQFYLLIVLLAPLMRNCRWWLIPLIAFPIAWAWRYGAFAMVPIDPTFGPFFRFWASTQLPGTLDEFAVGVVLARLVRSARGPYWLALLRRQVWVLAAVTAAVMWLTMALFWPRASFWDHAVMVVLWRSLLAVAFGLVVLLACCLQNPLFLRLTRPLRYLGTISYGIYLWHLPVLLSIKPITWLHPDMVLIMVLGLTLVFAAGSWHFFEKRFLSP